MTISHRKTPATTLLLSILLLIFVCIFGGILYIGLDRIPRQAQETFGPPSPTLSLYQQVVYPVRLILDQNKLLVPLDDKGNKVDFQIEAGESASSVADRLQGAGIIHDSEAFRLYMIYAGIDTKLQAGDYSLDTSQTALQIAQKLQDATPEEITFNILPGWRVEEIAASLPTSGLTITPEEFLQAASMPPFGIPLDDPDPKINSLEGFLLPDSYKFDRNITIDKMILMILQNFDRKVNAEIQDGFTRQGLTLLQGVILASIVQKEAVVEDEQPIIASVFLNRLANGMKLESDPTVQYALGYNNLQKSWWTNPLSRNDLSIDSPYNTYEYAGLPPGPIANPGLSALKAVAFPAQTPYFYFRAKCDGSGRHNFATNLEEQLNNACP
jgi:UPF0755 protein